MDGDVIEESISVSVFVSDGGGGGRESSESPAVEEDNGSTVNKKPVDSFDVEAMEIAASQGPHHKNDSVWRSLGLAFQTLGVVYGDLGTSPLYVFTDVFTKVSSTSDIDVLGTLSIVIYTIALIPLIKYVLIVLKANDNGEGGTFALYSSICRHANVSLLPNREQADERISSFKKLPTREMERALKIKEALERKSYLKKLLLLLVLMGTAMIIGDGILTPAISVMSAMSGLQGRVPGFGTGALVISSIVILVGLFMIQRFGTSKVGFMFAPVLALWFFSLGSIGIYNLLKHDVTVLRALNPAYIYLFFKKNGAKGWSALGSCVLCITGAEAMFADLGHFSVPSIQIAFTVVVFPCLLLAYMGQAAYLITHPHSAERIFFESIPGDLLFWPVFVTATIAAVIASQAMISASFSCIKQAMALGCFPRLEIIHTSTKLIGQIYIPVINYFLMLMCIIIVAVFRSTTQIANAYGIAEVGLMIVSTTLVTLIMLLMWQTNLFVALCFPIVFGSIELLYLSSVLSKIMEGGWVPLAFASLLLSLMYTWNYGSVLKYQSEVKGKISKDFMLELGPSLGTVRTPGIGLLYNELVQGIPSVLGQFLNQLPAIHSILVFVCIKYVPVPVVPQEERFIFRRVCPKDYHMFQCIARYGYKDVEKEDHRAYEQLLVESLEKFLREEAQDLAIEGDVNDVDSTRARDDQDDEISSELPAADEDPGLEYELSALQEAKESGFTYLVGHGDIRARENSVFVKKLVVNYLYAFLRRNCRGGSATLRVPHMTTLQVCMTYMV